VARLARDISLIHDGKSPRDGIRRARPARVIGITGSPGAGKSTLVAQLAGEYARRADDDPSLGRCAVVAFDPKSPITSGALLGDRLRVDFNTLGERVFYRSLAIGGEDYHGLDDIIELIGGAVEGDGPRGAFRTVFIETVGAGQNETKVRDHVDQTAVVLTPGMGDSVQMDKAGILEIADVFVCNKADHPGEHELVRDLRDIAGRASRSWKPSRPTPRACPNCSTRCSRDPSRISPLPTPEASCRRRTVRSERSPCVVPTMSRPLGPCEALLPPPAPADRSHRAAHRPRP
jgi:LAO/AO transport system kinase